MCQIQGSCESVSLCHTAGSPLPLSILLKVQQKSLCVLPRVLSLNCGVESEEDKEVWRTQQSERAGPWVPLQMTLSLRSGEGGGVIVKEVGVEEDEEEKPSANSHKVVYDLMMVVGHVREPWMEMPGNLVTHIKVGPSYHMRKEVVYVKVHVL